MPSNKIDTQNRKPSAFSLLKDMETIAALMRTIIVAMPPHDLLGYIYAQRLLKATLEQNTTGEERRAVGSDDHISENQFLLEYIHAVLASDRASENMVFDENKCAELFDLSRELRTKSLLFAMVTSADTTDGAFGPNTGDIEFRAKCNWVLLRGNRYQVLEGEFYRYVLTPHDDVLKEVYGVGAEEIAIGFQAMTDATRSGHANALIEMEATMKMMAQLDLTRTFVEAEGKLQAPTMEAWTANNPEQAKVVALAIDDMFRGGIANVSRHTKLPPPLLADLAYQRGEETEFFAPGDYAGTPYRTLPARKKPLIQLGSDYYGIDPCFTRDAGYRALLHNLLKRKPEYKVAFNERQKVMSEVAFADILAAQLPSAQIFQEVYYRDPVSRQWFENDTLILIEDVLFLVEAKAGAAATIASPALDFKRHAQSVQDLVIKAYKQCERFFNYLNSADVVQFYHLSGGKYVECTRVRRADYRVMLPIGLTVESFSPFSAFCKELPQLEPLLKKHAFLSLSIDDLFVLKRLLPAPGEFAHYMEVRQSVAGLRGAHLFDEFDHLGAYLKQNRFDQDMADQIKSGSNIVIWDGMSHDVDRSFERDDWEDSEFPRQEFPQEVLKLLKALDARRAPGWLSAESYVRNLGTKGRNDLATILARLRKSLNQQSFRYLTYGSDTSLFIWLQRAGHKIDWQQLNDKASAAALVIPTGGMIGIIIETTPGGNYQKAYAFKISRPAELNDSNTHIYQDAERMKKRATTPVRHPTAQATTACWDGRKPGRNDSCPCRSGLKYKKCHGR